MLFIISMMLLFPDTSTLYDFKFKSIEGNDIDFSLYQGKKVLIVNTASECGYTPQLGELEQLYQLYSDKLVIIGFPSNDFGAQEPGSNTEIAEFCQKNYGVTFPLMEKSSVKGKDITPLFKWLTSQGNPDFTGEIKWNFEKFLIDEDGKLIRRFKHKVSPEDKEITSAITQ